MAELLTTIKLTFRTNADLERYIKEDDVDLEFDKRVELLKGTEVEALTEEEGTPNSSGQEAGIENMVIKMKATFTEDENDKAVPKKTRRNQGDSA
jgi:hypothetical protein